MSLASANHKHKLSPFLPSKVFCPFLIDATDAQRVSRQPLYAILRHSTGAFPSLQIRAVPSRRRPGAMRSPCRSAFQHFRVERRQAGNAGANIPGTASALQASRAYALRPSRCPARASEPSGTSVIALRHSICRNCYARSEASASGWNANRQCGEISESRMVLANRCGIWFRASCWIARNFHTPTRELRIGSAVASVPSENCPPAPCAKWPKRSESASRPPVRTAIPGDLRCSNRPRVPFLHRARSCRPRKRASPPRAFPD